MIRSRLAERKFRGYKGMSVQDVFSDIYCKNHWGSAESVSGPGSEARATQRIAETLPLICREYGIASILDIPCGDFHWMKNINLGLCNYIGADVVPEIIRTNAEKYATNSRRFMHIDATRDPLPECDLIFCRDCFIHLSFEKISEALANFKTSSARYLLASTYKNWPVNFDVVTGGHRGIDLCAEPFGLPPPLLIVEESAPEPDRDDKAIKCMALWAISSIK